MTFNDVNDGSSSSDSEEGQVLWTEAEVAVLLRDDAVANVVYGVADAAGEMTAIVYESETISFALTSQAV